MEESLSQKHHKEGLAAIEEGGVFRIVLKLDPKYKGPSGQHEYYSIVGPDGNEWGTPCTQPEYCLSDWRMLNRAYTIGKAEAGSVDLIHGLRNYTADGI